ncbi:DNA cytosine methyltransferase [Verrucosispora sp. NA02020]|uniref:DNA cytosine methyltransferase n=1 Tax=Verrucosispora sp. NA02020 TaxID=2742132 RepID=UPI0015929AB4|nr:DNA (cytosine-5-)-methyltransferase [Verrucosispora sp. NA02020]QKW15310.1 DNA cytosine methyltransferase [Verrucosispora sp. NA02020]
MPTMAELCAGGGLLTRALEETFGVTSKWHAESDPAASKVLERRWPGVPNFGDVTRIAWSTIGLVDLLAAGFPCQPFSSSGKRGGSTDERHLWPTGVLPGIEALMPPVLVLENVPNLLRIERGEVFGVILADLDRLGYTVAWTVVGACKMGACHHRHRLFMLAVRSPGVSVPSQEPTAERAGDVWLPVQRVLFGDVQAVRWPASGVSRAGVMWPLPVETCGEGGILLPTPRTSDTNGAGAHGDGGLDLRTVVSMLPTPRASDTGTPGRRASEGFRPPLSQVILPMFPTPTARDAGRGAGRPFAEGRPLSEVVALVPPGQFGKYEPAVRRQEVAFGLTVPAPTEPGRAGKPRLAAAFPEWMMAAPRGFLTDVVSRNEALRIAGNGVFGPVVGHALSSLPTFGPAVALLSRQHLGVAA